jgi:NADPH-dependent 2,4-dienoyl-CoA reductase/sulfur reductase-like enzyme
MESGIPAKAEKGDIVKVIIIGGVAAGPKAASKIIRMMPDADVTIIEKGQLLSYAGCGLPYYVSGEIKNQRELMETPAGVVRDAAFFLNVKNLKVKNGTEALKIDRPKKRVCVKTLATGEESWLSYVTNTLF